MKFWKGSEAKRAEKRDSVIAALQAIRLTAKGWLRVEENGNVRDGDFTIGSVDAEGDFCYPVLHKHLPVLKDIKKVMRGMRRSAVSSESWKPNP